MIYLRPRSKLAPRRRRAAAAALIGAVVAAAFLAERLAPQAISAMAEAAAVPFWRMRLAAENGALSPIQSLLTENATLEMELAAAKQAEASSSVAVLEARNAGLLSLLGAASSSLPTSSSLAVSAVLTRPPAAGYDGLVLDLGSDQGAAAGDQVYAPGPVLIGRLTQVMPATSKAMLFSSPGQTYQVAIGPSGIPAEAVGAGGGQYSAKVPHGAPVSVGDAVMDADLNDRAFGVVVSVKSDLSDPFTEVLFAAPVNEYGLRWVLVGIGRRR